jgi:hydroxymethylbilane synthase
LIRVGTRGSALALAQAEWVGSRLGSEYELVTLDRAGPVNDKSRWVSGLERALLADEVDVAVHSAKDVPADLADGLELVAIPAREDARDAICGAASLSELRPGARVGTSSLRRAAQIRAFRDDLSVVEVRGNVDTRLRKLASGECDALVLAVAGLARLGRFDAVDGILDLDEFVPAAGQGALAVEARPGYVTATALVDDGATACVMAERELTRALGASCNTPVGAHARMLEGGELELTGWVGRADGSAWVRDVLCGPASEVGRAVADRLLTVGAAELLS